MIAHTLTERHDSSEDGCGRGTPLIASSPITAGYAKGVAVNDGKKGSPQNLQLLGGGVRRLTPLECERLQSFPDHWTRYGHDGKEMSDSARYRMLGNACPPIVTQWIGKRILESIA